MSKFPITKKGFIKLQEEIKYLKSHERPKVIDAISTAREFGDLSENAEYHSAREKQSFVEGRILDLEDRSARAEIIDHESFSTDSVKFGASIKILDDDTDEEKELCIVGEYEADISKGFISISSPLAKALIGKQKGDVVQVVTPKASKSYEILDINYKPLDI
ncbi:MAG: transcription elongation factor GreA [Rickettsiaceae bacterium]|nr:transcription elongation factor GreA [Rickettsiaceae bacterium]